MKPQILFIHGAGEGAYAADKVLVDSLSQELGEGYEIHYPAMPHEDSPDYKPWKDAILHEMSLLNDDVILIGHSLGGSVLMKCLTEEEVPKLVSGIFLLAAPFWGGDADWQNKDFALTENFSSLIPPAPVFLYHNSNDEIVPSAHIHMYEKNIAEAIVCKRDTGGHQFENGMHDIAVSILKLKGN